MRSLVGLLERNVMDRTTMELNINLIVFDLILEGEEVFAWKNVR
jgi:hypothetical protein